jgi:hypothetical protein
LNNFLAANQDQFPLYHSESLVSGGKTILEDCIRRVFPVTDRTRIGDNDTPNKC